MKNKFLSRSLRWLISIVVIFIAFWFMLPPINLRSREFWSFLVFSIVVCVVINAFSQFITIIGRFLGKGNKNSFIDNGEKFTVKKVGKPIGTALLLIAGIVVLSIIGSVVGSQLFNAKRYNSLISMEDGDFTQDVSEIGKNQIPIVDKDTAERLGQRKLGEMSDLVSQFEIQKIYTQINYKGKPVRVTPLMYGDIIKWFNNQSSGIPAYITVDMTTQETSLVRLDKGIKYSTSEYFMRNLNRYLRFKYPTKIFDNISFEINEDGTPYWVASTVEFKIGLWSGRDIGGAVLVNAETGECEYYDLEKIPTWVDQVYDSNMVLDQLTFNGKYRSGFFNSIFGQKGVLQPTDGYNYLAINDDVYLYTGMTSVMSDESNVGFVLTNLRTKDTKFYSIPGAEEYSAMSSAEGQVQHLKYNATFPLLLNISDRPTYFMSLKDDAGLVKMYAFVDVEQYQIVGTGSTVDSARNDYMDKLKDEDVEVEDIQETKVSGVIEQISDVVVSGNTVYYIKLVNDTNIYKLNIEDNDNLPFLKAGDTIEFTVHTQGTENSDKETDEEDPSKD